MNLRILITGVALLLTPLAQSEVIQISVSKQSPQLKSIERPASGMKKAEVEQKFGAPQEISGPVGEPPITKWHYADYIVYFEFDTVIHTVLNYRGEKTTP